MARGLRRVHAGNGDFLVYWRDRDDPDSQIDPGVPWCGQPGLVALRDLDTLRDCERITCRRCRGGILRWSGAAPGTDVREDLLMAWGIKDGVYRRSRVRQRTGTL